VQLEAGRPTAAAAACTAAPSAALGGLFGLTRMAIVLPLGTSSRARSNRLLTTGALKKLTPVMLPPGRLRLLTNPGATGSPPIANTMGIVVVAPFAANAAGVPLIAAITVTFRLTRSAASAGKR